MHTALNVCKVRWIFDNKPLTDYCLINGESFAEAAANLTEDYGEENLISIEIFPLETNSIAISKDLYEAFKNEDLTKVKVVKDKT